jgi:hypothetical protein
MVCVLSAHQFISFFQANLTYRSAKFVPRCIQQWLPGGVRSGPLVATCSWWKTEAFGIRIILNIISPIQYGTNPHRFLPCSCTSGRIVQESGRVAKIKLNQVFFSDEGFNGFNGV